MRALIKCYYFNTLYSKTSVKWPFPKRLQIGFQDELSLNEGRKYCRMLPRLLTIIKLPFVIKNFILSFFEWPYYTSFTVLECLPLVDIVSVFHYD